MRNDESERWASIPKHEGYEASSLGRVRSVRRVIMRRNGSPQTVPGKVLAPAADGGGYLRLAVGGRRSRSVHQLVLEAFVGPCPSGMEAIHVNGDPSNNRLENLRWGTHSENARDIVAGGKHNMASRQRCPLGHLLQEPNIPRAVTALGFRKCLACQQTHSVVNGYRQRGGEPPDFVTEADRRYGLIMSGQTTQRPARRRAS